MSNDLQTNLRYIIMINYDYESFSHCHLTDIFFAIHAESERVKDDIYCNFARRKYQIDDVDDIDKICKFNH